jgi:acyl-CoA synthetase (NDP forming)
MSKRPAAAVVPAERMEDAAAGITPLTDVDAREMVRSLRTFPLLAGYRGAPVCDVDVVHDVLLRLSALVEAHAEVAELDLGPLVASPSGAVIVDARVRLEAASSSPAVLTARVNSQTPAAAAPIERSDRPAGRLGGRTGDR